MIDRVIARLPRRARDPAEVLAGAAAEFGADRCTRMAAATAYRTVFAIAPLLMILVAVFGFFVGSREEAQEEIVATVTALVGEQVGRTIERVMDSAARSANTAAIVGAILLLWTASSLFLEIQRNLNDIFEAPVAEVTGVGATIRTRLIAFAWALGLGIALVALWGLNAGWRFVGDLLPESWSAAHLVITILAPVVSLILLPLIFALVFKTMTLAMVPWRAVLVGGVFTSLVLLAAAYGIGLYFQFSEPSALGFTGSLVLIIFLAFFFSSVFLFGAEVTKVYADRLAEQGVEPPRVTLGDARSQVLVAEPPPAPARSALVAFLIGLIVGWRRSRR